MTSIVHTAVASSTHNSTEVALTAPAEPCPEIAVKQGQQTIESIGGFDELEDALTKFNELINRRNWHQSVTTISLTDTDKNKRLAQYALQDFNHTEH